MGKRKHDAGMGKSNMDTRGKKASKQVVDDKGTRNSNSKALHITKMMALKPLIPEHAEERKALRKKLKEMGCVHFMDIPWNFRCEEMLKELVTGNPPAKFKNTVRAKKDIWTIKLFAEVYNMENSGEGFSPRTENFTRQYFRGQIDQKESWKLTECYNPELQQVLQFLVPILHPKRPYRVTKSVGGTIIASWLGEKKINWPRLISEVVENLAKDVRSGSPLSPFLMHLYRHEEILLKEEMKIWEEKKAFLEFGEENPNEQENEEPKDASLEEDVSVDASLDEEEEVQHMSSAKEKEIDASLEEDVSVDASLDEEEEVQDMSSAKEKEIDASREEEEEVQHLSSAKEKEIDASLEEEEKVQRLSSHVSAEVEEINGSLEVVSRLQTLVHNVTSQLEKVAQIVGTSVENVVNGVEEAIAQARTERDQARTERDQAQTERVQAQTERVQAQTERDQARTERDQARIERVQAQTERDQAKAELAKETMLLRKRGREWKELYESLRRGVDEAVERHENAASRLAREW